MTKQTPMQRYAADADDPAGVAWYERATAAWDHAGQQAMAKGADADDSQAQAAEYARVAPPLPDWPRPDGVRREILGRYLHDRDSDLVHDLQHADATCGIDGISQATFVHFAHELAAAVPDAVPHRCMTDGD